MNPELDRRLAELADAAARATSGIDPAATLAVFRRRRRARVAASTVAAAAAVVGLTLGANHLAAPVLDGTPPALPGPTRSAPSPTPTTTPTISETDEPPVALDGPGSCGRGFVGDAVTESEGAALGLRLEILEVVVARDGTARVSLAVHNGADQYVTGSYKLTGLLVEGRHTAYEGSVLTLRDDSEVSTEVSLQPGSAVRADLTLELDPCAADVLPLEPGTFLVSATVTLGTPGGPVPFTSPAVEVVVD